MNEKRAIVAVVLIFVVLFGFNYFQNQQRQRLAAEQAAVEQLVEQPVADAVPTDHGQEQARDSDVTSEVVDAVEDAATEDVPVELEISEQILTVDAPLWTATLSTRGGGITSWRLKDYDDVTGERVSLVSEGETGLSVGLAYGTTVLDTREWSFEYDGPTHIKLHEGGPPTVVRMSARRADGLSMVRRYTFHADSYAFEATVDVAGLTDPTARRDVWIGWPGIEPTEAKEDAKAAASVVRIDGGIGRDGIGRFKEETEYPRVGEIEWVTTQSRYFMAAVAPVGATCRETRAIGDREVRSVGFRAAVPIEGESASVSFHVFAGPQDYGLISKMDVGLERAVDMGWSLTRPLSVLMLRALVWAHQYVPNYGVVIIIFSILTKLLFYRLTHKSFTEMKRMQDVQPKLNALKEKYANDKEALAKAQMEMYKTEGVNPLGSCLPMILQMPVFIALFQVLRTTIELRGAPFMLWITDLSQPDTIAAIAGFPIHVLPVLMGVGMLVQQKFTTSDASQAAFTKMMPILFTVLFYNFAAGLVIYWLVNTILSVAQQYYIHRGPSTATDSPGDAAALGGVRVSAPASVTAVPAFDAEEAEVVEDAPVPPSNGRGGNKNRGRRRRKKK